MSIARHHAEWLSLVEVSGPFLSMPVLLKVLPDPKLFRMALLGGLLVIVQAHSAATQVTAVPPKSRCGRASGTKAWSTSAKLQRHPVSDRISPYVPRTNTPTCRKPCRVSGLVLPWPQSKRKTTKPSPGEDSAREASRRPAQLLRHLSVNAG